ncbi:MAG: hypothetical protein ACXU7D_11220, partial [Burkholderiaceae bacterium]
MRNKILLESKILKGDRRYSGTVRSNDRKGKFVLEKNEEGASHQIGNKKKIMRTPPLLDVKSFTHR